ncbi:MAG TPA: ATP-binding protein [Desulfuromonadales bacterium]|nr:ATP-binding protein [Desulfuromonadales bacterium]
MNPGPALEAPPNVMSLRRQLGWYLRARLAVVCFFLLSTTIYHLQPNVWTPFGLIPWLIGLMVLTSLQVGVSSIVLARIEDFGRFVHAQLAWDMLFVLLVIYLTGGVESLYSFLFILVIISASVFLPKSQVLLTASACAILYGALLDLQFYGYLPLFGGVAYPERVSQFDVFYAVFVHVGAFFLTALLGGILTDRLRKSEAAREKREIDYDELAQLNQSILDNINSGLMIISPEGRVRSFNNAACRITGYQMDEVYNRPADVFFEDFALTGLVSRLPVERSELSFRRRDGKQLILGYSANRVREGEKNLGLLIAFQDLTGYKSMEEQLKRADRLAAVGRLASGMAHEIRNPLASISGSVQLLLENPEVSAEDRRLMGIVIREADRLNLLLSDFLGFARPSPLQLDAVNLASLLDELIQLLGSSSQFPGVTIRRSYPEAVKMRLDRQKIRQALWDLMLNAAEAAAPAGTVAVTLDAGTATIRIEDSGPGVSEEARGRIFEPFFTTKDDGTGLGLANVYSNIEAHQGRIYVTTGSLGGACFVIELPAACWQPAMETLEHD